MDPLASRPRPVTRRVPATQPFRAGVLNLLLGRVFRRTQGAILLNGVRLPDKARQFLRIRRSRRRCHIIMLRNSRAERSRLSKHPVINRITRHPCVRHLEMACRRQTPSTENHNPQGNHQVRKVLRHMSNDMRLVRNIPRRPVGLVLRDLAAHRAAVIRRFPMRRLCLQCRCEVSTFLIRDVRARQKN